MLPVKTRVIGHPSREKPLSRLILSSPGPKPLAPKPQNPKPRGLGLTLKSHVLKPYLGLDLIDPGLVSVLKTP